MKKIIAAVCAVFASGSLMAQEQTAVQNLNISGYAELFYAYDFAKPDTGVRQDFLYTYNRHNEVNLKFGILKAAYETQNVRANLGIMAGTYSQDNLSAEQTALKSVYEANAGFKISRDKNIWIDAGVMPSHIGRESVYGKENLTLTRSMAAENSPYFETGAKISYTSDSGKWFLSGLVLNGWQKIARDAHNAAPSFGHQLTYTPNSVWTLNSSSFIGNTGTDSEKKMRYFHDFYVKYSPDDKLTIIAGLDVGKEEKPQDSGWNNWYTANLLAGYRFTDKVSGGARVEYFSDPASVLIAAPADMGFKTFGYSANLDYKIYQNILWRSEARYLSSEKPVLMMGKKDNFTLATSLNVWF